MSYNMYILLKVYITCFVLLNSLYIHIISIYKSCNISNVIYIILKKKSLEWRVLSKFLDCLSSCMEWNEAGLRTIS